MDREGRAPSHTQLFYTAWLCPVQWEGPQGTGESGVNNDNGGHGGQGGSGAVL